LVPQYFEILRSGKAAGDDIDGAGTGYTLKRTNRILSSSL
jgi:hypothetical protein